MKGDTTFTSYIGGTKKARITVNVVRKVVKPVLTYSGSLTYNDTPAGLKGTCIINDVAAADRTGFDNGAILAVACTGTKTGPQANLIGTGTISVFDASAVGATDQVQLNVGGALNWSNSCYMPSSKMRCSPSTSPTTAAAVCSVPAFYENQTRDTLLANPTIDDLNW